MLVGRKPYHRDDLRSDLLRAGREHVHEHGHEGLSIRSLAQKVGVSPGAPYHHFPDRRALLLALALDGFQRLWERAAKIEKQTVSPTVKLSNLAAEFFDFQAENPRLLELMYESELTRPVIDPAIVREQLKGYDRLKAAIEQAVPDLSETDLDARAVCFWSAVFGFGSLVGKGLLEPIAHDGPRSYSQWRDALIVQMTAVTLSRATEGTAALPSR